ncbi:uracil phosphoribosyltransferase [Mangrovimonas yunxiaonensis]|uniref:Uracil phosphoribosyltransferase n=1 Tax=Mangrovimonas yunxiaonensis TaxID=1197477 RepID=A0A084TKJ0_9FLAO|nr:uracil phosphoribosyltransferase [Mangrovimonas yunxiaonensis]KFB01226.1 uracil phosphoribosyltransferase [Mangrovimonas yunxiaonensis]MBR9758302.1 uracil phosphoribosyltransferase [Algicola sp.]GGH37941.1 uracil phosphoribosyltransferase [Mangrovimonas yunxiaonensis]
MQIHNLSETNSILNTFIAEMRDVTIQKDAMRFRKNIERTGEILGYELSKTLTYNKANIASPLGTAQTNQIDDTIVLCSILRAGVPLHNGLLNYFDQAENAFISAYRHHKHNPESFEIIVEYLACPTLEGKTLILADPMLATGQSMVATYEALKPFGTPKSVHLVSVIGAQQGVDFVSKHFNSETHLWIATIDKDLNEKGYIVPGLGDAGDLAFGQKLQN